ncbi:sensor domain-containing diguanylate cyclase [Acinetobacter sp. ANC 5054]|uniref:sensor domain-containing diguanylate cyclase n=1 Tax=Acinetobacter sp. ANC 5054 TaxID=1977877 RepID=UPI000A333981|nr:diguanylate cyclase [Acinetobacter sp. ANC 5054]OTG80481.1 sensor domain-containing diguanylate cyclase [Acinetobacter sp. ANC 5054]
MPNNPFDEEKLASSMVYKTLLESTLAIPWSIDWESKAYTYVGPQIEKLLGWKQNTWRTVQDWADRMHDDDRDRVVNTCVAQSIAGIDHEADYRALKADGTYLWVRDVVHVVRNENGEVDSLVGFMFDISERKKQEEQLQKLQRQLEEYSYKDGLTGIANRRLFDEFYQREWLNAIRMQKPLSLILLDLDYFKQYNDLNGHVIGDTCLRQIAKSLESCCSRPRDLVARYGGEEFAWILPETNEAAARLMADRIMDAVKAARLPHKASAVSDLVTLSMGIKTITPTELDNRMQFLDQVDKNLYVAKHQGRNRYYAA